MATKPKYTTDEVATEILGDSADFSDNLEIADPPEEEHGERALATMHGHYVSSELPAEDDEDAPEGARAIASKKRAKAKAAAKKDEGSEENAR